MQIPREEGLASLERDLNGFKAMNVVPTGIKVSWDQLDEGKVLLKLSRYMVQSIINCAVPIAATLV